MKRYYAEFKRALRFYWLKLLRRKVSTHSLALGLAMGIFAAYLPSLPGIPVQTVAALILAFVFRCDKIAALIGINFSNPFNAALFWYVQYQVGKHFVPWQMAAFDPWSLDLEQVFNISWKAYAILWVGGVILGLPSGIATYYVTHPMVTAYRKRRALRLLKRRTRRV